MATEIYRLSAMTLARRIRHGELNPITVVDAFLDRIAARNDRTNAFVTVLDERARERAREAARALEAGESVGPLHGVPIAIKDTEPVEGVRTTLGLKPLRDNVTDHDSTVVARLKEAGAIVIGKTNTPELAHRGTTENPLFGATVNPFDISKTAGGSSGGSAAAVADYLCPIAQGSDRSGSIRIPASFCGVYGLKPSFGRVPHADRPDAFAHDPPFDSVGPITRTVEDAALMLNVMAGPDPADPYSLPEPTTNYRTAAGIDIGQYRVAYCPVLSIFRVDSSVGSTVADGVDALAGSGATVETATLDLDHSFETVRDAHWTLSVGNTITEAHNLKQRYGVDLTGEDAEELSEYLRGRLEEAQQYSLREYRLANTVRTDVFDAVQELFETYDLLLTPTTAIPAFNQEDPSYEVDGKAVPPRGGWFLTWLFNLTGHPAASVPVGTTEGLPVGMQIVGRQLADDAVLAASAAVERELSRSIVDIT